MYRTRDKKSADGSKAGMSGAADVNTIYRQCRFFPVNVSFPKSAWMCAKKIEITAAL